MKRWPNFPLFRRDCRCLPLGDRVAHRYRFSITGSFKTHIDLREIAIVWSASAPVDAATWALNELPPGRLLDDTVVSIVQRWAQRDMDGATAWVEQFPEGALRAAAVENLLAQWSPTDPEGAQR